MARTIDYYLFLISPWSYLAIDRFDALIDSSGASVNLLPIDVGSTFAEMGGTPPPQRHPARQQWRLDELRRWSAWLDVPMNYKPAHFPVDQSQAARMVHALNETGQPEQARRLANAVLTAVWREERNIADSDTLEAIAGQCDLDAATLMQQAASDAIGEVYENCTRRAHEAGVFGSPTWVLDGEHFWGQDRLDFLERALA